MTLHFLQIKEEDAIRVEADRLRELIAALFLRLGLSKEDSTITADILVMSDLFGVDSHGVSHNIKGWYISALSDGRVNPTPKEKIVQETPATALIDGDSGLGHPVAYRGMKMAIEKARQVGVGIVSIRNSSHLGMAGYYPYMAVREDMIGIAMTSGGGAVVLPTFGAKPMYGTNPLSLGAPAGKHPAFLLDMATSVVAAGKLQIASLLGVPIPEGWALDEKLQPTMDPVQGLKAFRFLPLGGDREQSSHKGFGLGLAVEILCGLLSGHGYTPTTVRGTMSHFLMAIDIAAIRPAEAFKAMMDEMIDAYHDSPTVPGQKQVYIAGEIEWENYTDRSQNGIPLHKDVVKWLNEIAAEVGLAEIES